MSQNLSRICCAVLLTLGLAGISRAQTAETKLGLARNVAGTIHVTRAVTNVCPNGHVPSTTIDAVQRLRGAIEPNEHCDELGHAIPTHAVFRATWESDLRQPDWRGFHDGRFTIQEGTNVIASGTMSGSNGVGTHRGCEHCDQCNHFEGLLKGTILRGDLRGGKIRATYAGQIHVDCPSHHVPAGGFAMAIDGVVVLTNCVTTTSAP